MSLRGRAGSYWSTGLRVGWPAFQIKALPSALAETRTSPRGLKLTPQTRSFWPRSARASWPVETSQSLTVPSQPEVARRRPSGQ